MITANDCHNDIHMVTNLWQEWAIVGGDTTKPGLWTMDWTVDWTMDWAFLIEMSSLAINWFAAWPLFKLGGPKHPQLREENLRELAAIILQSVNVII